MRDALHQAAVAEKHPCTVIDDVMARPVKGASEDFLRERHADSVCQALPQRSGCGFYGQFPFAFRMTGGPEPELPEVANLVHRQWITGKMQQAVQQHRAVAVRQDEAIAIPPLRVTGVVLHIIVPQYLGDIRHAHRHAGMPRVGGLDGIHTERANCIGEISPGWLTGNGRTAGLL